MGESKKLLTMENDENMMLEAEIRGTMNSIELSTDVIYQDINLRVCEAQRQQIIHSQRCNPQSVKVREGETRCCRELPIWHGENFDKKGFLKPVTREISGICTPRVCSQLSSPMFNIGSQTDQIWVKIIGKEVMTTSEPQELVPH